MWRVVTFLLLGACTASGSGTAVTTTTAARHLPIEEADRLVQVDLDAPTCPPIVETWDENNASDGGEEIARGPANARAGVTWVFCTGLPGASVGLVSARSTDGKHWVTRALPIGTRHHAGDVVSVEIPDDRRAWADFDTLVGQHHTHVWTSDGGATWRAIECERGPVDAVATCDEWS